MGWGAGDQARRETLGILKSKMKAAICAVQQECSRVTHDEKRQELMRSIDTLNKAADDLEITLSR